MSKQLKEMTVILPPKEYYEFAVATRYFYGYDTFMPQMLEIAVHRTYTDVFPNNIHSAIYLPRFKPEWKIGGIRVRFSIDPSVASGLNAIKEKYPRMSYKTIIRCCISYYNMMFESAVLNNKLERN